MFLQNSPCIVMNNYYICSLFLPNFKQNYMQKPFLNEFWSDTMITISAVGVVALLALVYSCSKKLGK